MRASFTDTELTLLRNWADPSPDDRGCDPYNSANTRWNRWLLALAYGLL
jgi:hypothetical protein